MSAPDEIIHQSTRLRITSILNALGPREMMEFGRLKALLGATDGNMATHLTALEKAGYIRGYRADVAIEKLAPLTIVMVEITLKQHRYEDFERFERQARRIDEVVECHATGGGIDYLLKIVASDVDAFQRLIDSLLMADIGIDRYFSYVVTRVVKDAPQASVNLAAAAMAGAPSRRPDKPSAGSR